MNKYIGTYLLIGLMVFGFILSKAYKIDKFDEVDFGLFVVTIISWPIVVGIIAENNL